MLKEIKTRIVSVKNTHKITSAMKLVASAKLRKTQSIAEGLVPYQKKLQGILSAILNDEQMRAQVGDMMFFGGGESDLPTKGRGRVALVVFSSNSSMCGAFNANALKKFKETYSELEKKGYTSEDIDIYAVGRKCSTSIKKGGYPLKRDFSSILDKTEYEKTLDLSNMLVSEFSSGNVNEVILVYNHFKSAASQPSVRENYLPLSMEGGDGERLPDNYILEPDVKSIVSKLLPMVLAQKIYAVVMDSLAAEHAARMVAMQMATDNSEKLIQELTLLYNKGRQNAITQELLDIQGSTTN